MDYDSSAETLEHIGVVADLISRVCDDLTRRSNRHDQSKFADPEKRIFDEFAPKLANTTYGSEEYNGYLEQMKPALDHHYAANSHHPEHYRWLCGVCLCSFSDEQAPERDWGNGEKHRFCPRCVGDGSVIWEAELCDIPSRGMAGMSLVDLIEMLCDWKAATLRHKGGDIHRSIELNQRRFGYPDFLAKILVNTLPLLEGDEPNPE